MAKTVASPLDKVKSRGLKQPRTFFDTNVLLYAEDPREPEKRKTAIALILEHRRQRSGVVSLQVLQEFFVNAIRKLKIDPVLTRQKVEFHAHFHVVEPVTADILEAIDVHRLHHVSYWDALILLAARQSGCSILVSEDMQHGQVVNGVRIMNPFV